MSYGVLIVQDSSDKKAYFVKVHCPWAVLEKGAALLKLRKRIRMNEVMSAVILSLDLKAGLEKPRFLF